MALAVLMALVQPVWATPQAQQTDIALSQEELLRQYEAVSGTATAAPAKKSAHSATPSSDAYAEADQIFATINDLESNPAKRNASQSQLAEAAIEVVTASDSYAEGSLVRNGNTFTWWTNGGIRCIYSPRIQEIQKELTPENGQNEIVNEPKAVRGNRADSKEVYLIGPYYGYDNTFDNHYRKEASRIAATIGDTDGYTLYSGTAATVDKVAEAISNGSVVLFHSHGGTDYSNPANKNDRVTGATNSYLCLTSTTGLTSQDYTDGALYTSSGVFVNGTNIANHMTKDSPGGILWMTNCYGMATNTICEPLRQKGVEVVYGYSDSITIAAEYLFEEVFWKEMFKGNSVADSIATMKNTWGHWELSGEMAAQHVFNNPAYTLEQAREYIYAFPVVVSAEDPYPGQRTATNYGVASIQNVKSTYTLGAIIPGAASGNYFEAVEDLIYQQGLILSDGIPTMISKYEGTDDDYFFLLQRVPEGIQFTFESYRKVPDGIAVALSFVLQEDNDILEVAYTPYAYKNGKLVDYFDTTILVDRSTLTTTSEYYVEGSTLIDSKYASSFFNTALQWLLSFWDYPLYSSLGFGLKALGFTAYDGYGYVPCYHTYSNSCDPTCNICNRVRVVSHNYINGVCTLCGEADPSQTPSVGDITHDGEVNNLDVVYLLWHTLFPEEYPIIGGDITHDGNITNEDVVYLLWHTLFPEEYPLR